MSEHPAFTRASVVAAEGGTTWYEGAGILDSAMSVRESLAEGDLLGAGANFVVTGLSAIGAVMDPFQTIFAAGVGWLMEHVSILREPLDWLAGDPKEIEGHADTWRNIDQRVHEAVGYFVDEVNRGAARWTSVAAAAYRGRAQVHAEDVQALGVIADTVAEMTIVAGAMVGAVRNLVRDLVAEVVGAAISKAVQAVLVVTIPKIIADVSVMVAEYATKILLLLKRLVAAVGELTSRVTVVQPLLDLIGGSLSRATDGTLLLGAYRAQAAGVVQDGSGGTYRAAYGTISHASNAVYGGTAQFAEQAAVAVTRDNTISEVGRLVDKLGDDPSDDGGKPGPITLPL